MNIFSQKKWLVRLVVVLIALNVSAMCFILWQHKNNKPTPVSQGSSFQKQEEKDNKPPKKSIEELSQILKQELELSPEQEEKFRAIRQDFFDKEQQVRKKLNAGRDSLNEEMFSNSIDSNLAKQIARGIAENEYQIELYRLAQAQQLAKICTPQQLNKFQDLVKEMRDYFRPIKKKQ